MPYVITKSDGTIITSVADGTYDSTTSLKLVGKNLYNFGSLQNENFVYLLENFANNTAPSNPLTGQLWFDKGSQSLKVYNNSWKPLAVLTTSSSVSSSAGDLWFDPVSNILSINTGSGFVKIGPDGVSGYGTTRMVSTTMSDTSNVVYPVVKMYINNELLGILSGSNFILNNSDPDLTSFPVIKRGINLRNHTTNPTDTTMYGYADSAHYADNLSGDGGGVVAASTSSVASSIVQRDTNGNISVAAIATPLITSANGTFDGNWSITGNLTPATNNVSTLGSSGLAWSNIYSQNATSTVINAGTVNFNSLVDPSGNSVVAFDSNTSLGTSNGKLPTQQAVKSYVDSAITTITNTLSNPRIVYITPSTIYDYAAYSTGGSGSFLNATSPIAYGTPISLGWTNIDTSHSGVPSTAKAVILEVFYTPNYIGNGVNLTANNVAVIVGRTSTTVGNNTSFPWNDTFFIARAGDQALQYWNGEQEFTQVTIPVRQAAEGSLPVASFDFTVPVRPQNNGGMCGVAMRIIGYQI